MDIPRIASGDIYIITLSGKRLFISFEQDV
jgi:hypothetical protein